MSIWKYIQSTEEEPQVDATSATSTRPYADLPGTTISAPPTDPLGRPQTSGTFIDRMRQSSLFNNDFMKVPREALFGTGQDYGIVDGRRARDTGAIGWMYEALNKPQADKYQDRYDELVRTGADPERAEELATKGATERFSYFKPGLSFNERNQLLQETVQEKAWQGLELLDFATTPAIPVVAGVRRVQSMADNIAGPTIRSWLGKGASKDEIFEGLENLNLSPDNRSELTNSIWMHIHESQLKQSERLKNIQNVTDFVVTNDRALPSWLPENAVLQYVDPRTGEGTFFRVSPDDLRVMAEDIIDGTTRGVAGSNINGKIYHLTAKSPDEMLTKAGWKDGGTKTLEDVIEMIKPPKRRETLRNADGTFAGSRMVDEDTAYKIAANEIKAERQLAEQVKAFRSEEEFIAAVDSIADRFKKFEGVDKKTFRKNVSRIEERVFDSVRKYLGDPGLTALKKQPEQLLRDFYQRVTAPGYKRPSINELAIDRSFQEVSRGLERIFGTRVPIYQFSDRVNRGGAVVEGMTTRLGDKSVIALFRKAGTFDQAVANHEGWHWFKRNLSDAKQKDLDQLELDYAKREPDRIAELKEVYEKQPGQSDAAYEKMIREELMADEFARYYETGLTTWDKVKNFFDSALEALGIVYRRQDDIMGRVSDEFRSVKRTLKKDAGPSRVDADEALKLKEPPKSRRIKIDAEIKEIRKAINNKEYNAEQVGELSTRIDMIEEALPDVSDIRRVAGYKRIGDDTLSQIQASAQKQMETNDLAKNMTMTEAVQILGDQKAHNAKTLAAARIKRRANLDDFITEYGFDDLDAAQEAIEQFDRAKSDIAVLRDSLKQSRGERALANKASAVASTVSAERRAYVKELQDQFQLSDADIKKVSFGRDLQRMGESEFKGFINKMEQRAIEVANTRQAKWELMAQLEDMNFAKVENYRRAQGFPPMGKMNETQLRQYAEMLQQFQPGDEFLSQRTLETINRGELKGVNTMREVREQLWEQVKDDPKFAGVKFSDLENMTASTIDNMRYDTALAEKNPFYKLLVTRTQSEMMQAKGAALKVREEINRLTQAANKSRNRGVVDKIKRAIVPKQSEIIDYLEASPAKKDAAAAKLTKEELELAAYMENYYSNALDHLVAIQELRGSRYEDAYFTHTRKKFLEKWSDDGLVNAVRDMFQAQKDQAAVARIIDQDTGNILAKNKFFQYTLRRTGDVDPSQNATNVFLNYVDQFERKKALDKIIPELTVYTEALSPRGTTKNGLELDRSLKTFVNKYLNNKKARRENFGGLLEQGGKLDVGLRMGNAFVSLLDLGGNIFSSAATVIGEAVMTTQALGFKGMARGAKRRLWDGGVKAIQNDNVKKIFKEAEPFLGRNFWSEIADPNIGLGERALTGIYAPFAQSSVEMNKLFLLSKLTKEELATGKLSPKRLAELRLEAGRWRDMGSEVKSVFGSTSAGATFNKYKGWAIPIARTNIDNINKLVKTLRSRGPKAALTSQEFQETMRAIEITMAVYLIGNYAMKDENEDSFAGKLYARAEMEALTIMGGIDPRVFISAPRLATFLEQLTDNLVSLVSLEKYKGSGKDYEYGDLKGLKRLQRQLTPAALRQFNIDEEAAKKTDFKNKTFNKIIEMEPEEAKQAVADLTDEEWEMYKDVRTSWRGANTREVRGALGAGEYEEAVKFMQSLPEAEARRIAKVLTDEEWEQYEEGKGMVKSPIQRESLLEKVNPFK